MTVRPCDTTPEAWREVEEGIRRMTPGERIRRAFALTAMARGFALGQIRRQHPDESAAQRRVQLASRFLDAATVKAAFGGDGRSG